VVSFSHLLGIRCARYKADAEPEDGIVRYYLLQMPGWMRRLRVVIDWTLALFFRPDIVKLDVGREAISAAALPREECPKRRMDSVLDAAAASADGSSRPQEVSPYVEERL
jgi:hypothetical protein